MNRGWVAALTVTITLTLTLLAVEKYFSGSAASPWEFAKSAAEGVFLNSSVSQWPGIQMQTDARVVVVHEHRPSPISGRSARQQRPDGEGRDGTSRLRRPPEPAANAVLCEPLSAEDFVSLPLTHASSSIGMLMESMDAALDGPMKMVSMTTAPVMEEFYRAEAGDQRSVQRRVPIGTATKIPMPTQLFAELNQLDGMFNRGRFQDFGNRQGQQEPHYISIVPSVSNEVSIQDFAGESDFTALSSWLEEVQSLVNQLVSHHGLESSHSGEILQQLTDLSKAAMSMGEDQVNYGTAQSVIRTGYSLQRRVEVWKAIQACMEEGSVYLASTRIPMTGSEDIEMTISELERLLKKSYDSMGWKKYLLLDEIKQWVESGKDRSIGSTLAQRYLSRIRWTRLEPAQAEFLQHPAIQKMSADMAMWNRDPIDYRHLLSSLELVEQSPDSRASETIAEFIQVMRHASHPGQQQLAAVLNTHYRNANLRLTISKEFIERFIPEPQIEKRPVRERILGAYTAGDSSIQTKLSVNLLPDPTAWNIELGLIGEVVSNTQSSKGPAVFHNAGLAHVESQRTLRFGIDGYQVASSPTHVSSQDLFNRMSTDFDGLPVIGQFARMVVREQFNQKRGLAKRITQRKIAQETDLELDRRLEESLQQSEKQFQERILGPLQRLALDPMVVSMSTTQERLSVRYRLAHESQLTAFTPRPRAPAANLLSMQIHQSTLNNLLDRMELTGRQWRLAELYQHLGSLFNKQWDPPEDVPDDITLRFADRNPLSVELVDGLLRLRLRFAEFQRDEGLLLRNFVVTSSYMPVANGMMAGLVRDPDGVIEIQGKHLTIRERLALRVIFAKVFVSQPEISFVSDQWRDDPKAQDLGISQLTLRDGWLAIAISTSENPLVKELARQSGEALSAVNR